MELTADFHMHSRYSDGHASIDAQVKRAKELGLQAVAMTDHGFLHRFVGLRRRQKERYFAEIDAAAEKYGIRVLRGIEGNILGREGTGDLREEDFASFDVYLVGFHVCSHHESMRDFINGWRGYLGYNMGMHLKGRIVEDQTKAYLNAIKRNPVDILTHLNFQCFADALEVAKCCADYGTYVELSGKKTHLTDEELDDIVRKTEARFVLDSDAHAPKRVGDVSLALAQVERVGVPADRIDNIDGKMPQFRLAEFKKRL